MSVTVPIALFGWPLIALCLFAMLPPHRAVIANFVAGSLLLPVTSIAAAGLPDISKPSTMAVGALFDARRLLSFRPTGHDVALLLRTVPVVLAGRGAS